MPVLQGKSAGSIVLMESAAGLPSLFIELLYSHVLFFARDKKSEKIGDSLGVSVKLIQQFHNDYFPMNSDFDLKHFPIYGSRLQSIQKKMDEWRPQSLRELTIRPYKDPLRFYAFWLATVIGLVTILTFGTSLYQSYTALEAMKNAA